MDDIRLLVETAKGWVPPVQAGYIDEAQLQELIAANPHLVPGLAQGAVTAREFPTAAGPVDVVIVDTDGQVTVVECKRDASSQSRREIVGQALDYAGRLWQMPLAEFRSRFTAKSGGTDPVDALELDADSVTALQTALDTGRFRLVLALDVLNDSLCRLVDYLNEHTADTLTVVAMELRHWQQDQTRMLIPRTYGQEAARAKEERADPTRPGWTEESALEWTQRERPEQLALLKQILTRTSKQPGTLPFWTRSRTPSLMIGIPADDGRILYPYRIEIGAGDSGVLEVHFRWTSKASDTSRAAFLHALDAITELNIDADDVLAKEYRAKPVRPLTALGDPAVLDRFITALTVLNGPGPIRDDQPDLH